MRLLGGVTEPRGRTEPTTRHSGVRQAPAPPSPASLDTAASATTPAGGLLVSAWPEAVISSVKPRRTPRFGDGRGPPRTHRGRPHSWPRRSSDARNRAFSVGGSQNRIGRGGGGGAAGQTGREPLSAHQNPPERPLPALPRPSLPELSALHRAAVVTVFTQGLKKAAAAPRVHCPPRTLSLPSSSAAEPAGSPRALPRPPHQGPGGPMRGQSPLLSLGSPRCHASSRQKAC